MRENFGIVLGILIILAVVVIAVVRFIKLDKEQKITNIKEWLKLAVIEAEKAFDSGTGQLKLRYVYDLAVRQFPWIATLVSFNIFASWVDEALEWMKGQLDCNKAIDRYINGQ